MSDSLPWKPLPPIVKPNVYRVVDGGDLQVGDSVKVLCNSTWKPFTVTIIDGDVCQISADDKTRTENQPTHLVKELRDLQRRAGL